MVAEPYVPIGQALPRFHVVRRWVPDELSAKLKAWSPKSDLGRIVMECFAYLPNELAADLLERITSCVVLESSLALVHIHGETGRRDDYGVVSRKVITTAGVNFLAADMNGGASDINLFKFHGIGTGTTAEANADTALVTESTTALNPDSTRATGTGSNPSANIYQSVGTNTVDASVAATEHGLFTQAATGGGTLWDRSVFTVVNLASGDSLQSTYAVTFSAGG